jgi:hypothetical protein
MGRTECELLHFLSDKLDMPFYCHYLTPKCSSARPARPDGFELFTGVLATALLRS